MAAVAKVRDSNIELFRIFLMLMIIAHHYVVNSGITELYNFDNVSGNQVFLELWGWGGKVGINCFLLITGYFMCKQDFTWRKFLKLYLEVKFYQLLFYSLFCFIGKHEFSLSDCFFNVFNVADAMGKGFTASYIALFLLIPFINKLIHSLDRVGHTRLLLVLLFIYTVISTFFFNSFFEYIGWYVTVYLMGAYIRLYPTSRMNDARWSITATVIALILSFGSILLITYVRQLNAHMHIYNFVNDSNRLLAIVSAVAFFLFFKNLDLGRSKVINTIATATFGILLIHANGQVRPWLWEEFLKVKDYFSSDYLWLHAIVSCIAIYLTCCVLDILRQKLIEKPLFMWLDKRFPFLNVPVALESHAEEGQNK